MRTRGQSARHLRHLLAVVLAAGTTLGLGLSVSPSAAVAETDMEKAREAFDRGKSLYKNDKYEQAASKFKTAYQLSNRSELLYNIGKAYHEAGNLKKAEEYFQQYLDENPDAPNRQAVMDKVVKIQQQLAAQMGSVEISASQGTQVFVDDESESRCTAPCSVSLEPGSRDIHIRSGGESVASKTIDVSEGSTKSLAFEAASTRPPGTLHVRTERGGGALFVDGSRTATLPMSDGVEVEAGQRTLKVTGDSGGEWEGKVSLTPGETTRLLVSTRPGQGDDGGGGINTKRTVSYTLAGVSVALLAGGLLLGQNAQKTHDILSRQQTRGGSVHSGLVDKGRREMVSANILLGTGSAALLSGIGLFTWDVVGSSGE